MLKAIRRALGAGPGAAPEAESLAGHKHHPLQLAVAVLLHEARRADSEEGEGEPEAELAALVDLLGLDAAQAAAVLQEGRVAAHKLASFYAPVHAIKREFSQERRVRLVEHLWRVAFADGQLNLYEDHYVRKIAHLLYVPNTQNMLARNRARDTIAGP
jgi:uncharacterized tellurite resistance protein B-like protein